MTSQEGAEKNVKSQAVRILTILKNFYSLRELQEILGVPFQALWKYISLNSMPERETAERILSRIRERKLIERALKSFVDEAAKDPYNFVSRPSFISLFAFMAVSEIGREKVDVVMATSEASIPHATAISLELGSLLCPIMRDVPLVERNVLTFHYYDSVNKVLRIYAIPKSCFRQRPRILLVDLYLCDRAKVSSLIKSVIEGRAREVRAFSLKVCDDVKEIFLSNNISFSEILT